MANSPDDRTIAGRDTIGGSLLREFLMTSLAHPAAIDAVNELLYEHIVNSDDDPSVVAASIRDITPNLLAAATDDDWHEVTTALIADARATIDQ